MMRTMTHRPLPAFVRRIVTAIVAFGLAANAAAMQIFVKDLSGKTITLAYSTLPMKNTQFLKVFGRTDEAESRAISVSVGGKRFAAVVENTATGRAFLEKLPLTISMNELNGNEKYCYGVTLPTNASHCDAIAAGDLMLYGSDCLVLFYCSAGGYSYTRIGRLVSTDGLADALGSGDATVTFESFR